MLPHYLVKHNVRKQAIDGKLQGSVVTYLRCAGAVNNQIKKGLLLSLSLNFFFNSVNIWQSYKQERGCLVHFLRLLQRGDRAHKVHETTTFLLVTLPNIHPL